MFKVEHRRVAAGLVPVLVVALLCAGCTVPARPRVPYTGDPIRDGQAWIEQGPPKDKVLWEYRTALYAMRGSDFPLATKLFDDAILNLGAMMQPDAGARKARGYFTEEAKKTFYGEPYERVMAWYYRGILYWMAGQLDNARACFRSAQFQDADAENNEYKADYVILDYLEGLITDKLGGDGSDAFQRAQKLSKIARLPAYNADANVILFIDFGAGPQKYASGEYGEELRFREGSSPVKSARLSFDKQTLAISPTDDLYYQATTRGGRLMDHVLGNKAVFKKTTDTVGNAALITGSVLATRRDTQDAGLAVLGAGILAKIFASATRPEADTRTWQNLPQYLSFAVLALPPGDHQLTVNFLDAAGQVITNRTKMMEIAVIAGRDNVFYVSDQTTPTPTTTPNSAKP